jgi:threonine synthase
MWKAFEELERIGWTTRAARPRMVVVQAEGCAPIVRAYENGEEKAQLWDAATTVADGLRVPRAIGDFLILRAVRESGGTAIKVPDSAMIAGMLQLGHSEGISASPEGGAALAAIERLSAERMIRRDDIVVLFNTGGALKYLDLIN